MPVPGHRGVLRRVRRRRRGRPGHGRRSGHGRRAGGTESAAGGGIAPDAIRSIQGFAFAFFIPIYFAIVGLQLDLIRGFNVGFFLLFLLLACAVKAGSVYLGARLAGQASASS